MCLYYIYPKCKRKIAFILLSLLCEIKVTKQTNLSMKSSASENMCITIVGYISTVDKQMSSIEGEDPHISLCFVDHSLMAIGKMMAYAEIQLAVDGHL